MILREASSVMREDVINGMMKMLVVLQPRRLGVCCVSSGTR